MKVLTKLTVATLGFIGTIFAANYLLAKYGVVYVLGMGVPAGTVMAGLAFVMRDMVQEVGGKGYVLLAIVVGGVISWTVSSKFAMASAATFIVAELIDYMIYTPLREKSWLGAVVVSSVGGIVVDSVMFLWLAFGGLEYLGGQIVGKMVSLLVAVGAIAGWRYRGRVLARGAQS